MDDSNRICRHVLSASPRLALGAALLFLSLPLDAQAATGDVEVSLKNLVTVDGAAYVAARDTLLADAATHAAVRDRLRNATFTDATWREDAVALALVAHLDDANAGRALDDIQGIDPRVYEGFRRPEPIAGRELVARSVAPGILAEAFMKTSRLRRYTDAAREEPAYRRALLVALTASDHAVARPLLSDVMRRGGSVDERSSAAVLLGDLGADAVASLADVARDERQPNEVRTSALVGLGRTRTIFALDVLVAEVTSMGDDDRTDAAIRALGVVGDAWVADAAPSKENAVIRARATETLVGLLPAASGTKRVELIGLSLATIADPSAIPLLDAHISAEGQLGADASLVKRRVARAISRRR